LQYQINGVPAGLHIPQKLKHENLDHMPFASVCLFREPIPFISILDKPTEAFPALVRRL
jgi:hypothetical protein